MFHGFCEKDSPLLLSAIEFGLDASRGLAGFEVGSCLTLKIKKSFVKERQDFDE